MFAQHHRFQVWNAQQHPYRHSLADFAYINSSLPGVSNMQGFADWVTAVIYPQSKASVANVAALPAVGNVINDYRVVTNTGAGKAGGYRWEQREGESSASWHQISEIDWGADSVLQEWQQRTQDQFVMRYGYDSIDGTGTAIVGTLSGQVIYGGRSASTNLTFYPNAGDGAGAVTGKVQTAATFQPAVATNTIDIGATAAKFRTGYFGTSVLAATMTLSSGLIADSSGALSFGALPLTTTGSFAANSVASTTTLTAASGSVTVDWAAATLTAPIHRGATTTGANLTLQSTVHATKGKILFGTSGYDEVNNRLGVRTASPSYPLDVVTTGGYGINVQTSDFDVWIGASLGTANAIWFEAYRGVKIDVSNGVTFFQILDNNAGDSTIQLLARHSRHLVLGADGTDATKGTISRGSSGQTADLFQCQLQDATVKFKVDISGNATAVGYVAAGNLKLLGDTLSTTDTNGDLILAPNGTGSIKTVLLYPAADAASDLGKTAARYRNIFMSGTVGDGTNTIAIATLLSLRNILSGVSSGYGIFYNGSNWVAADPDTEVFHDSISHLTGVGTDGDAGHSQFVVAAGRASAQTIKGGTAASASLTLDSTAHATKGSILAGSTLAPTAGQTGAVDLGIVTANLWRNLYLSGQIFGCRVENTTSGTLPAASAANPGRLVFETDTKDLFVDTGGTWRKIGVDVYVNSDAVSWDGATTSHTYDVSGTFATDARKATWQLQDNANNRKIILCDISFPSTTTVTVAVDIALAAGTYTLVGVG